VSKPEIILVIALLAVGSVPFIWTIREMMSLDKFMREIKERNIL